MSKIMRGPHDWEDDPLPPPATEASDVAHDFPWLIAQWKRQAETCRADAARIGENEPVGRELLRDAAQYEQSIYQVETILSSAPAAAVGGGEDAEPEDDPQHALSVEQAIARLTDAVHEGAVKHAHFREVNGMDVDYHRCIGAGLFSAANKGLFSLTPPPTHPTPPAGGFVVVPDGFADRLLEKANEMRKLGVKFGLASHHECANLLIALRGELIAASPTAQPSAKDGVKGEPEFPEDFAHWWNYSPWSDASRWKDGYRDVAYSAWLAAQATTASGLVDGDIPPEMQDAWDAIDDVTFGPLGKYAKDVIARYLTPGMKGHSRIVGSRTIDGVHIIVAKPASDLMPEQLLVRYDTYLSAIENASQALQAIVDYEGDINTPIRTITKLRGIARAAITKQPDGTGEAAIGREVGE